MTNFIKSKSKSLALYLSGSMQVHYDINRLPPFKNAVLTIGTFDGVHLAHQQIIKAMQAEAKRINGETALITFSPHPRKIVQPNASLELINTLEERIGLLHKCGIDHLIVVPFTQEFANLTAEEYIGFFLVDKFHPHTIIIGYDHHFGKNREGNFELLQKKRLQYAYKLIEIPKHVLNEAAVSSTKIRQALKNADIQTANELLGYSFFFQGKVVHGDKIGRQLGYPTANLSYTDADKIHLAEGVYAVWVTVSGSERKGMLSIGKRPTVNDTEERIEVNIFDFDESIYDEVITVTVKAFLRHQEKYDSLEELVQQLHKDKEASLAILEE